MQDTVFSKEYIPYFVRTEGMEKFEVLKHSVFNLD